MKIFNLGIYGLKTLERDLEICSAEHMLDVIVKRTPAGFLCI